MHSYPLIHAQGFHNTFWAFSNTFHSFACPSVNCEWIVLNFVSDLELSKTEALQVISTWYHYSLIFNHVLKMKSFLNRPIIPALPYMELFSKKNSVKLYSEFFMELFSQNFSMELFSQIFFIAITINTEWVFCWRQERIHEDPCDQSDCRVTNCFKLGIIKDLTIKLFQIQLNLLRFRK